MIDDDRFRVEVTMGMKKHSWLPIVSDGSDVRDRAHRVECEELYFLLTDDCSMQAALSKPSFMSVYARFIFLDTFVVLLVCCPVEKLSWYTSGRPGKRMSWYDTPPPARYN